MWGQRVRVTTRRPEAAQRDTLVLEFETGLESRPILRKASDDEVVREGGTRVRVWLTDSPYEAQGLLHRGTADDSWTLSALCAWLAPTLDVNLYVEQEDQARNLVLTAND